MDSKPMPFVGGPWDGEEIPVDIAPNGGLPDRWDFIETRIEDYNLAAGPHGRLNPVTPGRIQIRHEYWLTNEPDGRPVYAHQDEQEW